MVSLTKYSRQNRPGDVIPHRCHTAQVMSYRDRLLQSWEASVDAISHVDADTTSVEMLFQTWVDDSVHVLTYRNRLLRSWAASVDAISYVNVGVMPNNESRRLRYNVSSYTGAGVPQQAAAELGGFGGRHQLRGL